MNQFSFEFPYIFILLPLLAICGFKCPARNVAIYFPHIHILLADKAIKNIWLQLAKWLGLIFLIVAIASPVVVAEYKKSERDARDIMLVIDSSKSMLNRGFDNNDLMKSKFKAVIEVIDRFIKDRESDRIGIINFASQAFIASPLTFDKKYLSDILNRQQVGIVGKRTAIYDSLLRALYLLSKSETKTKVIVLLTDGSDNMSKTSFEELLEVIKKSDVKLYVIGVGEERDLEVDKLKKLAEAGNGKFFLSTNKNSLESIYKEIDKSEATTMNVTSYTVHIYYYYFPLMLSILSLVIYIYLKSIKGIMR
jgi:Ca-activated chloride channel family protein